MPPPGKRPGDRANRPPPMTDQRKYAAARRAALYSRYSTDLQSDRSNEDQAALCRAYASREGLGIVASYEDRARSGASIFGRPGLEALLAAAERREFDVLIVEALDRLSRDMADLAGMHRRLSFLGISIHAVHEGVADTVAVGLRGVVAQLYREDGVKKIRRGMEGVVRDARYAGGRPYGYRPTPGEPGRLQIVPEEAEVIRRIFAAYAAGKTPREIAGDLNRDGVAPPRGVAWNASTINGNRERGHGIIQNAVYGGEIVWNRVRMVKDPATGRRLSRPNPESEWRRVDAPWLAIVDQATLLAARTRKAAVGCAHKPPQRKRSSFLSGLLKCGCCGAGMVKHDMSGLRPRIRCSREVESGSCDNRRRYYLDEIEQDVVAALRHELDAPEAAVEFARVYAEEMERLAGNLGRDRAKAESRIATAQRQISRLVDSLASGGAAFASIRAKLETLEAEKQAAEAALDAMEMPRPVALHPKALDAYREALGELADAIARQDHGPDARVWFQKLVARVVVKPTPAAHRPRIEIVGRLAELLQQPGGGKLRFALGGTVVAEVRYFVRPQGEPVPLLWEIAS